MQCSVKISSPIKNGRLIRTKSVSMFILLSFDDIILVMKLSMLWYAVVPNLNELADRLAVIFWLSSF